MDDSRSIQFRLSGEVSPGSLIIGGYWRMSVANTRIRDVHTLYPPVPRELVDLFQGTAAIQTLFLDGGHMVRSLPRPIFLLETMEDILPKGRPMTSQERSSLRWPQGVASISWISLALKVYGNGTPLERCYSWKALVRLLVKSTPESSSESTIADRLYDLNQKADRRAQRMGVLGVLSGSPILMKVGLLQALSYLRTAAKDLELLGISTSGLVDVQVLQALGWFYPVKLPRPIRKQVDEYIRIEASQGSNTRILLLETFDSRDRRKVNKGPPFDEASYLSGLSCDESITYFLETQETFRINYFCTDFTSDWPTP
ncbi:nonstructural protein [Razdan virus]|uniref:Nonstructural protein n=1 Tax=Razdan virus TaxID=1405807 RepID=U5NJF9_9VIRU|nr:nonstructural protein [Razdan virus]AGY30956.1 nonstructural protein [Razdan virus]